MFFVKNLHHKINLLCSKKGFKFAKYMKKVLNMLKINKIIILNQNKII